MKILLFDSWSTKFTKPLISHWESLGHTVVVNPQWDAMKDADRTIFYPADNVAVTASKEKIPHTGKVFVNVIDIEYWAGQATAVDYTYFDGATFISQYIMDKVMSSIAWPTKTPYTLIQPGIDTEKFYLKPPRSLQDPIRRIAYVVGDRRIWDVKRFDVALMMLRDLLNTTKEIWQLHVLGSYSSHVQYNDYCNYLIDNLKLKEFIIWYDRVDDVSKWLDDKDFFLLPSTKEAFSYATAEAMSKGIKPILGNWRGSKDVWGYHSSHTYGEMFAKFTDGKYTPNEYRQYVEDEYTQERYFKQLDDFFEMRGGERMDTTFTVQTSAGTTHTVGSDIAPPPPLQEADIVQPVKPVEEPKVEHKYKAVRASGDSIFLLVEGKKHWILNPDVYTKLGFKFGEEEKIESSELATYLPGETITPENYTKYL